MTYADEVLADSPLAYWRLGESSGTTLADASGNGRSATLTSGTLGTAGALSGDADTAITNPLVNIADAAWMEVTNITVECWVKFNSTTGGDQTAVSRYGADGFVWMVRRNSSLNIRVNFENRNVTSPATYANGSWLHVAATYSSAGALTLYVNGTAVASTTGGSPLSTATARKIQLGQYSDSAGTNLAGDLDEVAIYGSVLSPSRIAAHYAAGSGVAVPAEFAGAVAAGTSVTGALLANRALAGTVAATSDVLGEVVNPPAFAGVVAATAGVSGAIDVTTDGLSGAVEVVSGVDMDPDPAYDGGTYTPPAVPDLSTLIPRRTFAYSLPPR